MKALLIRAVLLAGLTLGAVGCNNTIGTVGFPTITIGVGAVASTYDKTNAVWKNSAEIIVYNLPGSPGGIVRSFGTQSGGVLTAGITLQKCDVPSTQTPPVQNCGPYKIVYAFDSINPPQRVDWTITSYIAEGDNGIPSSRNLGSPQTVF